MHILNLFLKFGISSIAHYFFIKKTKIVIFFNRACSMAEPMDVSGPADYIDTEDEAPAPKLTREEEDKLLADDDDKDTRGADTISLSSGGASSY